jgi:hypothetical protein
MPKPAYSSAFFSLVLSPGTATVWPLLAALLAAVVVDAATASVTGAIAATSRRPGGHRVAS